MIKLLFLARLREAFGRGIEQFELNTETHDVAALLQRLRSRGGVWALELAPGRAVRVAVNQEMAQPTTLIQAGDEVAIFPPVTGG